MIKCSVIASLLLASPLTFAATIESGTVQVTGSAALLTFTVHGDGFAASGCGDMAGWVTGMVFPVGASIASGGGMIGNSFGPCCTGTVGGTHYPFVNYGDLMGEGYTSLQFTGPPVTVTGPGLYETVFSFTGRLCGTTG